MTSLLCTYCSGYLLNHHCEERVIRAIESVNDGFRVYDEALNMKISEKLSKRLGNLLELDLLTEQEVKLVRLVTMGMTDLEIAKALYLDHGHVRNRLVQIREKLKLRNSKELAVWGVKMGLL